MASKEVKVRNGKRVSARVEACSRPRNHHDQSIARQHYCEWIQVYGIGALNERQVVCGSDCIAADLEKLVGGINRCHTKAAVPTTYNNDLYEHRRIMLK
jgi:hypothetical protein